MSALFIKIYEKNPDKDKINQVVDLLRKGAIIIYPTDTVYALGCDIFNAKAMDKILRLKGIKKAKEAQFSFVCHDMSHIADYAKVSNVAFKLMRKNLPGAFTFILPAHSSIPKTLGENRKSVGIRVPDHSIPRELVKNLERPIITTSLHHHDQILDYETDPELLFEAYQNTVDVVIDGGYGNNIPSTVVDLTKDEPQIIRKGLGILVMIFIVFSLRLPDPQTMISPLWQ